MTYSCLRVLQATFGVCRAVLIIAKWLRLSKPRITSVFFVNLWQQKHLFISLPTFYITKVLKVTMCFITSRKVAEALEATTYFLPPKIILYSHDITFVRWIFFVYMLPYFGYNSITVSS